MDTKKTNREGSAQRPRQQAPGTDKKRPEGARPAGERPQGKTAVKTKPAQRPRPEGAKRPPEGKERPAAQKQGTAPRAAQERPDAQPKTKKPAAQRPAGTRPVTPQKKRRPSQEDLDAITGKKRAYGKSKPKKKPAAVVMGEAVRKTWEDNAAKRKAKAAKSGKKQRPKAPTPAVIYTQPQAFSRNRLIVQLLTVTAVVLALVLALSVFFKVKTVTVAGAGVYDAQTIKDASGIKEGDSLLTFSRTRAGARIFGELPYIKNVSFGIKLPDTVNIIVEEEDVVYAVQAENSIWWLMNSEGRVVEQILETAVSNYTKVLGLTLASPTVGGRAEAAEYVPVVETTSPTEGTESTEDTAPMGVTGAQRLSIALSILKTLEENDIVGSAASVDVSRIDNIVLWYGTRYQINLGDANRMAYKVTCMKDVIAELSEYQSGILDVSFNIWTDQVGYTPFS